MNKSNQKSENLEHENETKQEFLERYHITEDQFCGKEKIHGNLDIYSTSIPEGFNPAVEGDLCFRRLRSIPRGFSPTVDACLYFDRVTSISEGFNPTVGGRVYLPIEFDVSPFLPWNKSLNQKKTGQNLYFNQRCWTITADGIVSKELVHGKYIAPDCIIPFDATLIDRPLIEFTQSEGKLLYGVSSEGERCHFLKFLINTSNFTWRTGQPLSHENAEHLLAKLCAFGYLLHDFKDMGVTRAVIGVDGTEAGAYSGRSGKSLFGRAIARIRPQVYIPCRSKKSFTGDAFLFHEVTEKTGNIFFDDVRVDFDFESISPFVTGSLTVNVKHGRRYAIPFSRSPKIYAATRMISGSPLTDHMWTIAFSDFYNDVHYPIHDFDASFFSDWPHEQWNLFYNLCATSIRLYLKFGVIESPKPLDPIKI
ncbi:MAG: hypothetical protein LBL04_02105 [Bacteroidales bacterium]|jgi:hypothetical protein|nr:hypothetical protein [Bacteroidales bacterium]